MTTKGVTSSSLLLVLLTSAQCILMCWIAQREFFFCFIFIFINILPTSKVAQWAQGKIGYLLLSVLIHIHNNTAL